jgi:nicotinate phosphoribosyltransferase
VAVKEFIQNKERAQKWTGLRQDSGDPFLFAPRAKELYQALGINYREKLMVYSDALNTDKVLAIQKQCKELGFEKGERTFSCLGCYLIFGAVGFGIGTFLSNDFWKLSSGMGEKSKALNIVIKIKSVDGRPCVKLSDEPTKVRLYCLFVTLGS